MITNYQEYLLATGRLADLLEICDLGSQAEEEIQRLSEEITEYENEEFEEFG
jgi:hypothetical protein